MVSDSDGQAVNKIGFADLYIFAARDIRRVFGQYLKKQIADGSAFAADRMLEIQFRRVEPDAAGAARVGGSRPGIQSAADKQTASQRNGIGQRDFGRRLVGGRRQGRRRRGGVATVRRLGDCAASEAAEAERGRQARDIGCGQRGKAWFLLTERRDCDTITDRQ